MNGFYAVAENAISEPELDAVVAAAAVCFAFVFIHPLPDGNGRIHRYLIHSILSLRQYVPTDTIFPISAAIVREPARYLQILDSFSRPRKAETEWNFREKQEVEVSNDTRDLYRFFDATAFAEYLYTCLIETLQEDWSKELNYLKKYDEMATAVQTVIELPNREMANLVNALVVGDGTLSKNERRQFSRLSDEDLERIEALTRPLVIEFDEFTDTWFQALRRAFFESVKATGGKGKETHTARSDDRKREGSAASLFPSG